MTQNAFTCKVLPSQQLYKLGEMRIIYILTIHEPRLRNYVNL